MTRLVPALALPLVGALALAACTSEPADPAQLPATDGSGNDVGVQMFQWTWDALAAECTDVLGPAGYDHVLTSPPQEHVLGPQWWTAYQPVSYQVESRLGTREQFAAMVDACHAAGVDVWVDAVINHMTGQEDPGTGWAGSSYTHYAYPGLYGPADFHHCGLTPNDDIAFYLDKEQVQTCELLNLADLDTGAEKVRTTVVGYLQDLVGLGVDGFRIDAAKHMSTQDVGAIVDALPEGTAIAQEVIRGASEPITPEEYLPNGQVYEFSFGKDVQGVLAGTPGLFLEIGEVAVRYVPSESAVVFVDNHDTERNGSTLSYKDGADYVLANVLMLAGKYGSPEVHSGYAFTSRDAGPLQDGDGRVRDAGCGPEVGPDVDLEDGAWVCQQRWAAVRGMVGWRAVVGDVPVTDAWHDDEAVAFGRGERGFVVVNAGDAELRATLTTSLPDGTYCDVLTEGQAGEQAEGQAGECVGTAVEDGRVEVVVPPRGAVAWDVAHRE